MGNVENLFAFGGSINGTGNGLDNQMTGTAGSDIINGLVGNDTLSGGDGDDKLNGGSENDWLYGNGGNDTLNGGLGDDRFVFDILSGQDRLQDFVSGSDKLVFDKTVFQQLIWINDVLVDGQFETVTDMGKVTAGMHLVYNAKTGDLFYDADGFGSGSAETLLATFGTTTHPAIAAADFAVL